MVPKIKDYFLAKISIFFLIRVLMHIGGNSENGKLLPGGIILLRNSLISWNCYKQKIKYLLVKQLFSLSEICIDIVWTVNLLNELN